MPDFAEPFDNDHENWQKCLLEQEEEKQILQELGPLSVSSIASSIQHSHHQQASQSSSKPLQNSICTFWNQHRLHPTSGSLVNEHMFHDQLQNLPFCKATLDEHHPPIYTSFSAASRQSVLVNQLPIASLLYSAASPDLNRPGVTQLVLPKEESSDFNDKFMLNKDFSPTLSKARTLFYLNPYPMPILEEEEHRLNETKEPKADEPKSPIL